MLAASSGHILFNDFCNLLLCTADTSAYKLQAKYFGEGPVLCFPIECYPNFLEVYKLKFDL